jgi:orotate phosphoribosyltransferase
MRICVCGGRDFTDRALVWKTLNDIKSFIPEFTLVHGGAKGADSLAAWWAERVSNDVEVFPAEWVKDGGKSAGIKRNIRMLESGIDLLVAFPGGKGTAHMISICERAGVPVRKIE